VDAIHEGGVVAHLRRHGAQQVANPLLLLDIDVEVADHHDAAFGTDILLGAAGCCRAAKAALAMR